MAVARGPLTGLVVLDLSWVLAGPFASMILADLGAEVIKIERPPYGDVARTTGPYVNGESAYFFSVNRGKKSACIDLKSSVGHELFLELCDKADVVLENFTPGTMDNLNLGSAVLCSRNPRLIYAAISGFGQTGPLNNRPALDIIVQGMGGIMSITGEENGTPIRPGISQGDITAGLYTVIAVLAALYDRERSGQGQVIDISMLDCQTAILENAFIRYFATGEVPRPTGTRHPTATPFQAFPTLDGWIVIALSWGVENQWPLFCSALGCTDLIDDPRFDTPGLRTRNHSVLEPLLVKALKTRPTDEWLEELIAIDVPCGPVNNIGQAAAHPQTHARDMIVEVTHPSGFSLRMPNTPLRLSRTPARVQGPSPILGSDTDQVLRDLLALSDTDLEKLRRHAVIFGPLPSPAVRILEHEADLRETDVKEKQ